MFDCKLLTILSLGWAVATMGSGETASRFSANRLEDLKITPEIEASFRKHFQSVGDEILRNNAVQNKKKQQKIRHRKLQPSSAPTRECGQVIGRVTIAEVAAFSQFIASILAPPDMPETIPMLLSILQGTPMYDFQVSKQCSSCSQVSGVLGESASFREYCAPGKYGYFATQSWLLFEPLDPQTGSVIEGKLRGLMQYHQTLTSVLLAPTESWPENFGQTLQEGLAADPGLVFSAFMDYYVGMIAAGYGSIVMTPDYIGYGESTDFNRSFIAIQPYMQTTALSWFGTQNLIEEASNGCTQLENAATVTGFSEGGYAAISGGTALSDLGVRILAMFTLSAPIDIVLQTTFTVDTYNRGLISPDKNNAVLPALVAFLAFAYSNEYEFLANTGTGQRYVNPEWANPDDPSMNIFSWYQVGAVVNFTQVIAMAPPFAPDIVNQFAVGAFQAALLANSTACSDEFIIEGETEFLCLAATENDAERLLETVTFPTIMCHSPDDTLVTFEHLPEFPFVNPFVQQYQPTSPLLAPQGDHVQSQALCSIGPLGFFTGNPNPEDPPNLITPVEKDASGSCLMAAPTPAPTKRMRMQPKGKGMGRGKTMGMRMGKTMGMRMGKTMGMRMDMDMDMRMGMRMGMGMGMRMGTGMRMGMGNMFM